MAWKEDKGFAENFLTRDGRLNRWRFVKRNIVLGLIESLILMVIFYLCTDIHMQLSTTGVILVKIVSFIALIPYFCLVVRRLHDMNKDEKLAYVILGLNVISILLLDRNELLNGIPSKELPSSLEDILDILNLALICYVLFCPGTHGSNKYGSDPLE